MKKYIQHCCYLSIQCPLRKNIPKMQILLLKIASRMARSRRISDLTVHADGKAGTIRCWKNCFGIVGSKK